MIEDRRLIRVLDVIELPATDSSPAMIAVINEWVQGHTLSSIMESRHWEPLDVDQAVGIVWEVAQALVRAHALRIRHGRLLPSSVVMTDAAEVRIIGMSIDAVLLGAPHEDLIRSDLDALGGLLYFLLTGKSPFFATMMESSSNPRELPSAPRHGAHLEPASHVRADVPPAIDALISRAMIEAKRPRGTAKLRSVEDFLGELTKIRDHVDPVAIARESKLFIYWGTRAVIALAIIAGLGLSVVAFRQLFIRPETNVAGLTSSSTQVPSASPIASRAPVQILPIRSVTSFDPFGDDNLDSNNDGVIGREREALAKSAIDASKTSSWKSQLYAASDADGKGGVGLVLDLGTSQSIASVTVKFANVGTALRIGVADAVVSDPAQWQELASAPAGKPRVTLRSPRTIAGRYVLLWFAKLPPSVQQSQMHQVRVANVIVRGIPN
jgi:serine/threonine protein kinase